MPEEVDQTRIAAAVREILLAIGEDPDRPGLVDTPRRVAASYAEVFAGIHTDPATFLNTTFAENHNELVLVRDITFFSVCEHHLLPFQGVAHVGYIPGRDGRVAGLSTLIRVVEAFAHRPQVQERLTTQIADTLVTQLRPRGAIVVLKCKHLCMAMRGVRNTTAEAVTSAVRGWFKDNPTARSEALSLMTPSGAR